MNLFGKRVRVCAPVLLVLAAACGTKLIHDPSFELWCGDALCAPWESKGKVARVGTWHAHDYAVSLGDGAEISQRSDEEPVECIEFELIADVAAEAEVQLELDFMDDGSSEYEAQIAESRWARLRFLVKAPSWYDGLRFRVRKLGKGRAVIAQLSAVSSGDCKGEAIELDQRPNGVECEVGSQCAGGRCVRIVPNAFGFSFFQSARACAECEVNADCPQGSVCGVRNDGEEPYRACVQPGPLEAGDVCQSGDECGLGLCLEGVSFRPHTCAGCLDSDDCAEGEVCGLDVVDESLVRICEPVQPGPLGELCTANAECASGVCCFGACAECCGELAECPDDGECKGAGPNGTMPVLCDPGKGAREAGEACGADGDCSSGECELPASECLIDGDPELGTQIEAECRLERQHAGVCR